MSTEMKCWVALGDCGHVTGVVTEGADSDYAKRTIGRWAYRGDTIDTMTIEEFRSDAPPMCDCDSETPTDEGEA